jgi:excinuclease UvrABC nuclease subunit
VLYVGKARNLRKRLSSYRVANPERLPRRIVRLLFRVRRIEFDDCKTDADAIEREAALICVLQPRFNRAGQVWSIGG